MKVDVSSSLWLLQFFKTAFLAGSRYQQCGLQSSMQVLEFLLEVVEALKNNGYTLTEAESSIFIPCLVEKVNLRGQSVLLLFMSFS